MNMMFGFTALDDEVNSGAFPMSVAEASAPEHSDSHRPSPIRQPLATWMREDLEELI
jgi:hypothetical protein